MLKQFLRGIQLNADICYSQGVLEPKPGDNRGITELEYILFMSMLASYIASLRHRSGLNILAFTLALRLVCEELQVT